MSDEKKRGHLVLTREVEGRIFVNGPCVIEVVAIRGDKVRMGIKARNGDWIHREEVYREILSESPEKVASECPELFAEV